jgi:aerobic-type carbon monoxide dehydrogenase small subunit (CoxS/CutS family)
MLNSSIHLKTILTNKLIDTNSSLINGLFKLSTATNSNQKQNENQNDKCLIPVENKSLESYYKTLSKRLNAVNIFTKETYQTKVLELKKDPLSN